MLENKEFSLRSLKIFYFQNKIYIFRVIKLEFIFDKENYNV